MKRIFCIVISLLTVLCLLASCGGKKTGNETADNAATETADETSDGGLKIITTVFPIYDWTKNVLGDKAADADLRRRTFRHFAAEVGAAAVPEREGISLQLTVPPVLYDGGHGSARADLFHEPAQGQDLVVDLPDRFFQRLDFPLVGFQLFPDVGEPAVRAGECGQHPGQGQEDMDYLFQGRKKRLSPGKNTAFFRIKHPFPKRWRIFARYE